MHVGTLYTVTIASAPQVQQHTPAPHVPVRPPAPPRPPRPLPGPPSPPRSVPPDRPQANKPPTRHQNLNILQLNIDGLRTKHALYRSTSPDITFCSPSLSHRISWRAETDLSSDHLPIIITLPSTKGTNFHTSQTIRNYNRSSWEEFARETEVRFQELNTQPITNIDHTLTHFNTIIAEADKKHVFKGNRKKYNPNFTPDISRLIRTRNNLRCTPTPHSQATTDHIHELNEQIKTSIRNRQKQRWEEFVATLDHRTNSSKLYRTIRSLTNSNSGLTPSHSAGQAAAKAEAARRQKEEQEAAEAAAKAEAARRQEEEAAEAAAKAEAARRQEEEQEVRWWWWLVVVVTEASSQAHEAALASLREDHKAALASLREEHEAALASLREEHEAALASLREEHEAALASLREEVERLQLQLREREALIKELQQKR
ncbi:uncharacterized protein LOC108674527, partial [Hyalella azteca]|uniref:Uncharacterized protein LOC108674527 n=1 Tax=Hyalella azteca TaxID=294128 RepID=A0A8B7NYM2_HYAAZ